MGRVCPGSLLSNQSGHNQLPKAVTCPTSHDPSPRHLVTPCPELHPQGLPLPRRTLRVTSSPQADLPAHILDLAALTSRQHLTLTAVP